MNAFENLPAAVVLTLMVTSAAVGALATAVAFLLRKEPTTKQPPAAPSEPDFAQVQHLLEPVPGLVEVCTQLARQKKREDLRKRASYFGWLSDQISQPSTGKFLLLAREICTDLDELRMQLTRLQDPPDGETVAGQ